MNHSIEDFLDFGQIESGTFKLNIIQFDVKETLIEVLKILRYRSNDREVDLYLNIEGFESKENNISYFSINSDKKRLQ